MIFGDFLSVMRQYIIHLYNKCLNPFHKYLIFYSNKWKQSKMEMRALCSKSLFHVFSFLFPINKKTHIKSMLIFKILKIELKKVVKVKYLLLSKTSKLFRVKNRSFICRGYLHTLHDFFGFLRNGNHQAQFTYMKTMSFKTEIEKTTYRFVGFRG